MDQMYAMLTHVIDFTVSMAQAVYQALLVRTPL